MASNSSLLLSSSASAVSSTTTTTTAASSSHSSSSSSSFSSSSSSSSTSLSIFSPSSSIPLSPSTVPLTIVLKVGSSSISAPNGTIRLSLLSSLVELCCSLQKSHRILLVSSGAISIGCLKLNCPRPIGLSEKQAVAAVGQSKLMALYDSLFSLFSQPIAQVLLTRENINQRPFFFNLRNTFTELMRMRVIPVINENDSVSVAELVFGDNDTLSSLVASLVEAHHLFLLTDVNSLFSSDPNKDPTAMPIHVVDNIDAVMHTVAGPAAATTASASTMNSSFSSSSSSSSSSSHLSSTLPSSSSSSLLSALAPQRSGQWGTGGMATKLAAARVAVSAGCFCSIVHGQRSEDVKRILEGDYEVGTTFRPSSRPIKVSHKRWIAHFQKPQGSLRLNEGAARAILSHKSLFAAGIVAVSGSFQSQSMVLLLDQKNKEIARAMISYSSLELEAIKGKKSSMFQEVLGYTGPEEVAHRDSIAITATDHAAMHHEHEDHD